MEFDFRVVHKIIPINTLSGKKSKWRDIQSHNRTKADMVFKVESDFIRFELLQPKLYLSIYS